MDVDKKATSEVPSYHTKKLKLPSDDGIHSKPENSEGETYSSGQRQTKNEVVKNFIGGPSSWYAARFFINFVVVTLRLLHFNLFAVVLVYILNYLSVP